MATWQHSFAGMPYVVSVENVPLQPTAEQWLHNQKSADPIYYSCQCDAVVRGWLRRLLKERIFYFNDPTIAVAFKLRFGK